MPARRTSRSPHRRCPSVPAICNRRVPRSPDDILRTRRDRPHMACNSTMTMAWDRPSLSRQRDEEIQVERTGRSRQRSEGEAGVLGIEEPVDDGSAGAHPLRELGPGDASAFHVRENLVRKDLLLRSEVDFLANALLVEEGGEGGADVPALHGMSS